MRVNSLLGRKLGPVHAAQISLSAVSYLAELLLAKKNESAFPVMNSVAIDLLKAKNLQSRRGQSEKVYQHANRKSWQYPYPFRGC